MLVEVLDDLWNEYEVDGEKCQASCSGEQGSPQGLVDQFVPERKVEVDAHHDFARHHDAGDDGRVAEAALEVADKALCPVDEDVGDAGLLHQGTGQHEERHCHEGERVHTGEELLWDDYTGERGVKEKNNDEKDADENLF